jgi:hypothetical protein
MRKKLSLIIGSIMVGSLLFTLVVGMASDSDAKDAPPQVVISSRDVILTDQQFVAEYDPQVQEAKLRVQAFRELICDQYKEYCKAEYLNPAKANIDLSSFLARR